MIFIVIKVTQSSFTVTVERLLADLGGSVSGENRSPYNIQDIFSYVFRNCHIGISPLAIAL